MLNLAKALLLGFLRSLAERSAAVRALVFPPLVRLKNDEAGSYLVVATLTLPAMIGFAGLGTEAGLWFFNQQKLQAAADSGAVSAGITISSPGCGSGSASDPCLVQAEAISANYDFVNGSAGVTVAVNKPPTLGNYAGNNNYLEVIVTQPQTPLFSAAYGVGGPILRGRAVVALTGGDCVLALGTGNAVTAAGTANVTMTNCGLFSDASIFVGGSAHITAELVGAVVGYSLGGSGTISPTPTTGDTSISNPYASVAMPSVPACNQTNYNPGSNTTIGPALAGGVYVFCNNTNIAHSVTLQAGTYIQKGGTLTVASGGTLTSAGANVTLVFTNNPSNAFQCNGNLNLTAPTSGALSGIAMFEDPAEAVGTQFGFSGSCSWYIAGAMDLPKAAVSYQGTSSSVSPCTQLIAYTISFAGTESFANGCAGTGAKAIGATAQLVE